MDFNNNTVLIDRLINGEERAYVFLLDKFYRTLFGYALSLVHDHALAQDIVQNVFLKTWKYRKKLKPELSIRNFLLKAVYNEFINSYRKNEAMLLVHQKYVESTKEMVESTNENELYKIVELMNKEIQNLPPKCRKVFILSKKEGLTNFEISEYLDISSKTVEAQITKAFKILKGKLSNKYNTFFLMIFGDFNNLKTRINTSFKLNS